MVQGRLFVVEFWNDMHSVCACVRVYVSKGCGVSSGHSVSKRYNQRVYTSAADACVDFLSRLEV